VTKNFITGRGFTTSSARAFPIEDSANLPRFDNELVYALSCVRYIREHAPAKPAEITATQRKHLNLLDGIALLLVTEDKSDVAAASFLQKSKTINFFYAKNRPCTASEKAYIGSLLELIRNYDPSEEDQYTWDILNIAVRTCLRKVRNRIQKLSKELRKSGFTAQLNSESVDSLPIWHTTGNPEGTIGRAVANGYSLSESENERFNKPNKTVLASYFHFILEMDVSLENLNHDFEGVLQLVMLSHQIGILPGFYG
jgi:hypothetical protein